MNDDNKKNDNKVIIIIVLNFHMVNIQPTYSNYLKNPMKTKKGKEKESYYIVLHGVRI